MQDYFVGVVHVHTLDNIDFTVLRPTRSDGPECRPCTANTPGHVLDVNHVQALVVKLLAFDPNGIPTLAVRVQSSLGVHSHVETPTGIELEKSCALCALLVEIVDKPIGWIFGGKEVNVIQKGLSCPVLNQLIVRASPRPGVGHSWRDNRRGGQRPDAQKPRGRHDVRSTVYYRVEVYSSNEAKEGQLAPGGLGGL